MDKTVSVLLEQIQQQLQLDNMISSEARDEHDSEASLESSPSEQATRSFQDLRSAIDDLIQNDALSEEKKAEILQQVQSTLSDFEQQAQDQRQLLQQGLSKFNKGRRSLKQYQQNS